MIDGGGGDDIISGGRGDDNLSGGKGNDTYRFSRFDGNDTIRDKDTTPNNQDQILFGESIASDQLWFSKKGNDLYIQVIGTTDSITINQHYVDESYRIERFQLANGKALSVAKIDALVSAMSAFAPPKAGQMTLPDNYQKELNATIAASWQQGIRTKKLKVKLLLHGVSQSPNPAPEKRRENAQQKTENLNANYP